MSIFTEFHALQNTTTTHIMEIIIRRTPESVFCILAASVAEKRDKVFLLFFCQSVLKINPAFVWIAEAAGNNVVECEFFHIRV